MIGGLLIDMYKFEVKFIAKVSRLREITWGIIDLVIFFHGMLPCLEKY